MYRYIHVYVYTYVYVCMHIRVCVHIGVYLCTCVYMCICINGSYSSVVRGYGLGGGGPGFNPLHVNLSGVDFRCKSRCIIRGHVAEMPSTIPKVKRTMLLRISCGLSHHSKSLENHLSTFGANTGQNCLSEQISKGFVSRSSKGFVSRSKLVKDLASGSGN